MKLEIETDDDSAMIDGCPFFAVIRNHALDECRFVHAASAAARAELVCKHVAELLLESREEPYTPLAHETRRVDEISRAILKIGSGLNPILK